MIDRVSKSARRWFKNWLGNPTSERGRNPRPRRAEKDDTDIPAPEKSSETDQFSQYEMRLPTHQNAFDLLPGWSSAFPSKLGLAAGKLPLLWDSSIRATLEAYGPKGKTILEVGPIEGMLTYMLTGENPTRIDAIEAKKQCFLHCLVIREIPKLNNANFYLGDIKSSLEEADTVYDLAIASGVLYHMDDPARFLTKIGGRSNAIFIWTQFHEEVAMPLSELRHVAFT